MATSTVNVNSGDLGWPGLISNIDESTSAPDGQTINTTTDNDVTVLGFQNPAIGPLDTVTGVDITIRCRGTSSGTEPSDPSILVELLIGGISQGSVNTGSLIGSMSNRNLSNAGWDAAWTSAQLDGLQVRLTADEGFGVDSTFQVLVDCIDVVVTFDQVLPISREPLVGTLALAGKIPDADVTSNFKIEVPPVATLSLTGQVFGVGTTRSPPVGQIQLAGKLSYLNTLTERLQIDSWDAGWPTGFVTNVDEPSANADGQTVSTTLEFDTVNFGLDNTSLINNEDTVLGVSMVVRGRITESGPNPANATFDVSLIVNGLPLGPTNISPSEFMANYVITNTAWNLDLSVSQINSMQVRVSANGVADDFEVITWYIDTIDVVVEYSEQSPIVSEPAVTDLDFTGHQPETFIAEIAVPGTETLALAGKILTVELAESVHPSEDILVLTEQVPRRIVNFLRLPAIDTLALTGQAPTKTVNFLPLPAIDTLALAGKVPVADTTANHVALPARRSLTLAPEAPLAVDTDNFFAGPAKGMAAWVGKVPTLEQTTSVAPVPDVSTVVLAGQAPAAVRSQLRPMAAGALLLTTTVPLASFGTPIEVSDAAITTTGYTPVLGPLKAGLVLTTQQPVAVANHLALPAAATLVITPQPVDMIISGQITPVGVLTLATHTPTLEFSSFLTPGDPRLISLTVDRRIEFIATPTDILIE